MDEPPREKLTRSQRKNRDVKPCAWAQLLEDKDLGDSTSITAKQFRVDFRIPYSLHYQERGQSLFQPVCLSNTLVQPERTKYRQAALLQTAQTKSTKIHESIKTILIASKRRLCVLHVPEEFSHIYSYYVL